MERHLIDGTGKRAVRNADDVVPVQLRRHRGAGRCAVIPGNDRIAVPRAQGIAPFAAGFFFAQGLFRQLVDPGGHSTALRRLRRRLRQQQVPRHLGHLRQYDAQAHQESQSQAQSPLQVHLHGFHSFSARILLYRHFSICVIRLHLLSLCIIAHFTHSDNTAGVRRKRKASCRSACSRRLRICRADQPCFFSKRIMFQDRGLSRAFTTPPSQLVSGARTGTMVSGWS